MRIAGSGRGDCATCQQCELTRLTRPNVRKVTSGFLVFRLLLGEESGESDDFGVDGFRATRAGVRLVVGGHLESGVWTWLRGREELSSSCNVALVGCEGYQGRVGQKMNGERRKKRGVNARQ